MNILALNWQDLSNPLAGGAEVHLEELLRRLAQKGHRITLFCSGYEGCKDEQDVDGLHIIRRGNRYNFNIIAPRHLRRLAENGQYDVLIEDINKIPFYTPLYLDLPTLVVVPHLFSTTVFREINFLLGLYIYLAEKPLVPIYRGLKFNVISESTADDIADRGIPRDDISVIHCGIDSNTYFLDDSTEKYPEPTILYLGRIKKYKSIDHLIRAFKLVKNNIRDARLKIIGGGDYLPSLKALAASLQIEGDVEFPGFVPSDEKVNILRRSHLAVYPSLKEGWGLTNIEANACGTTVVAANVPGLRDSVVDNETGFLYEYGDIPGLARRIETILYDTATRVRLERGGLAWAEKFSWDRAADRFMDVLRSVVEKE